MSFQSTSRGSITPTPERPDVNAPRTNSNPFDSDSVVGVEEDAEYSQTCCGSFCRWYLFPFRHIGYSVSCALYCGLNCPLAFVFFFSAVFTLPFSVALLVLCCSGIIVFYISCELRLLFAYIDLAMAFYMTEDDQRVINRGGPRLGYRTRRIPLCTEKCTDRIKLLLGDGQSYKILIYNLLFKPFAAFVTFFALLFLACLVFGMIMWIFFLADPPWFKDYQCYPLNIRIENNKCIGWDIKNIETAIGLCFAILPLLSIGLRVTMLAAKISKIVTYFFLTDHFLADEIALLTAPEHAQANVMATRHVYGSNPNDL